MHTVGIILAGGASQRMRLPAGTGKAGVALAGRSLLEHVCRAVRPEVGRLVVVAAPDQPLPDVHGVDEIIRDSRPGAGPLAGVADGLRAAGTAADGVFVASCDVPLLAPAVVRLLLAAVGQPGVMWAVPMVGGHPQVLVSAMQTGLLAPIDAHLASGRRDPRGLLEHLQASGGLRLLTEQEVAEVDPALVSFTDADSPEDVARLEAILPRFPPSRA